MWVTALAASSSRAIRASAIAVSAVLAVLASPVNISSAAGAAKRSQSHCREARSNCGAGVARAQSRLPIARSHCFSVAPRAHGAQPEDQHVAPASQDLRPEDARRGRCGGGGGAAFLGFVFYPPSPRAIAPDEAAALIDAVPAGIERVGLFVDPDDDLLAAVLAAAPLSMIQLHGHEPPERVDAIRARFGLPVMKALAVAEAGDLAAVPAYAPHCAWLLFDAKPPHRADALPGGNALSFDWRLLRDGPGVTRWMLAGGLDAGNVAEAVRLTGAPAVDVSSGVEKAKGVKDPALIAAFLRVVAGL
ncbi:MAG: phosphoribosylanthranilate isomerase [Alphaproteobacteria bacterium]